jgi:hypothetical protein
LKIGASGLAADSLFWLEDFQEDTRNTLGMDVRQAGEEDKLYDSCSYNNPSIHGVRFCF